MSNLHRVMALLVVVSASVESRVRGSRRQYKVGDVGGIKDYKIDDFGKVNSSVYLMIRLRECECVSCQSVCE